MGVTFGPINTKLSRCCFLS